MIKLLAASVSLSLALAGSALAADPYVTFTPFHANGIYALGERVGWTLRAPLGGGARYNYTIRENDLTVIKSGVVDLSSGMATIETTLNEPGMIYVRLTDPSQAPPATPPSQNELDKLTVGAAVAPTQLQPSAPRPADFDTFWSAKLAKLATVPINPVLAPMTTDQPGVSLSTVTLDSLGSHVHGYLAAPTRPGKYPALVIYQYAGVYPLSTATVTTRASEGWLAFDVDSHDMAPDQATAPANYAMVGDTDRETSYFLNMYLRDTRALDYIESRPDWDGKTIVLLGTSMGGQQSLVTAGLNPARVTAVVVDEPAGGDTNAELHGHASGYPNWPSNDPRIMSTALYFDPVNFASRIQAPSLVAVGFIDTTVTPVGVWTEFNQIPAPKEIVAMVESDHNHITPQKQEAFYRRSKEVLDLLRGGGVFTPDSHAIDGH